MKRLVQISLYLILFTLWDKGIRTKKDKGRTEMWDKMGYVSNYIYFSKIKCVKNIRVGKVVCNYIWFLLLRLNLVFY